MHDFVCLSISPIEVEHPGLAVATARAGGIAILDREFCRDASLDVASRNLQTLLSLINPNAPVGLRLKADQITSSQVLLKQICAREHWLIVCGWELSSLSEIQATLTPNQSRKLLIEVTNVDQVSVLADAKMDLYGLVARGHESGGWVGEDSALILTQKLLEAQVSRVYVQGGIGIHSAAACRAVGVAGVVLDDQLWLMPESPLPVEWRQILSQLNGQETLVIGEKLGVGCRVLSRPGFKGAVSLSQYAEQLELEDTEDGSASLKAQSWREKAPESIGWGSLDRLAWPLGQASGLATYLCTRYKTTGRLVQAILKESLQHVQTAQSLKVLQPQAPLAVSHGTRYPIVQGPMTRVSDTAEFADAVSLAGALPLLALALMRHEQVTSLLRETSKLLGSRPWGIGILGFVPQELREEQLQAILEVKPPFALIAGGRPAQAAQLEAAGIATYIHVPVPSLLKIFLEEGVQRFVFEGRECGGHVGPLSSFMLWESMIETLLSEVSQDAAAGVHVLFAGGIHDARSAAMVSVMAAPLVARGMRIGVLMGTAYMFTEEAVSCGAIVKEFQEQALMCNHTINLETGPGHAIRCATTSFSDEFYSTRRRMLKTGSSPAEITNALEKLTLGRLRIASKGAVRNAEGTLNAIGREYQLTKGMYMIGQLATMRSKICPMGVLHNDVSEGSAELLVEFSTTFFNEEDTYLEEPSEIAIVGISTILPKAQTPEVFWQNLRDQVNTITEIPQERWDWRLYYDQERKIRDKINSKWGGFLDDVPFDPIDFGIPPNSLKSINSSQLLALKAVQWALEDAGYESGNFDRENTSVILGTGEGAGPLGDQYVTRSLLPLFVEAPSSQVWERLPEWTEESFSGTLANVSAGRIANRFDLGGSNFVVDAACASSLTAIGLAIQELESGRSNVVITGGVDTAQSPYFYTAFSKTHALSPSGCPRTFDQAADGIVISEGIAVVILKRLADAERDGDRIYAVIRGAASSSDGKALGLTAPRSLGQMRALNRAYRTSGIRPSTIGLYEAHGTGTMVGDRTEVETIVKVLEEDGATSNSCAIGSAKSLIGHTKTAAGAVGLIKAALSLYHQVLPPHAGVNNPLNTIANPQSPVSLLKEARPWFSHPDHPRRSGVSAFGFGGTNSHVVLEEYTGDFQTRATGSDSWPCELLVLRGENRAGLSQQIRHLLNALRGGDEVLRLRDVAYSYAKQANERSNQHFCLCLVVENLRHLQESLELSLTHLEEHKAEPLPSHILLGQEAIMVKTPLAFVFPGQGAQYPDMAREVALYFDEMRAAVEFADRQLRTQFPKLLSQYIYPPGAFSEADERSNQQLLKNTHVAQPAIGIVSIGLMDVALRLGLKPNMVCGHSYGEYTALHGAGVLSREDFLSLSETRGRLMSTACSVNGTMAVVWMKREELKKHLNGLSGVVVANHNAPHQLVISGEEQVVRNVVESLSAVGIRTNLLPVSGAFHSSLMTSVQEPLSEALDAIAFHRPEVPIYANATSQLYSSDEEAIRSQLSQHLLSTVEFVKQINQMYEDGARIFVELGPKNILTGLIDKILAGRKHKAVSFDGQGGGLRGLLIALGTLQTQGVDVDLTALFKGRDTQQLNLSRLVELNKKAELSPTAWLVNGDSVRPQTEKVGYSGKLPPLNQKDSIQRSKQKQNVQPPSLTDQPSLNSTGATPITSLQSEKQTKSNNAFDRMSDEGILAAYQAHEKTMRQFLKLQEKSIQLFLGGQESVQTGASNHPASLAHLTNLSPPPTSDEIRRTGDEGIDRSSQSGITITPNQDNLREGLKISSVREESVMPAVAGTSLADRETLSQLLLDLVSKRTGYPKDMLGLDQDMEAELGIDSIKRLEILDAFQKSLPESSASDMQMRMESLTRAKSLNVLIDAVLQDELEAAPPSESSFGGLPTTASRNEVPVSVQNATAASSPTLTAEHSATALREKETSPAENGNGLSSEQKSTCPREVIEARSEPLPKIESISPVGLFLITEDKLSVAPYVSEALKRQGAHTAIIDYSTLSSPAELERVIAEYRQIHGPVSGIVHLAALAAQDVPETLAEWRTYTQVESKSLFQLVHLCFAELQKAGQLKIGCVLAASLLGGNFGRDGQCGPGLPSGGSSHGLLKSLEAEGLGLLAKAIDFDNNLSPEKMAQHIVEELLLQGGKVEVGYPQGNRTIFDVVPKPLTNISDHPRQVPDPNWVVLITGGARGITAEAVYSLVKPGMQLIVVGRSPKPKKESIETAGIEEIDALRQILLEQAKADGASPTPSQIETQLQELHRNRAIHQNLERLCQAGVLVEYRAIDVRDEEAFGALINEIYSCYSRLDAVIHGAGIIEDKLIADKSLPAFDRVFDTKVDSTFILSRYLRPDSLKLLVLFSSVAGRLGNRGQSDYAAANEVMNRFAWRLNHDWPNTHVLSINWGPWDTIGMASAEVNRRFRERGIIPIQPSAGSRFFVEEINYGKKGKVEVFAGKGPWTINHQTVCDPVLEIGLLISQINKFAEHAWLMSVDLS